MFEMAPIIVQVAPLDQLQIHIAGRQQASLRKMILRRKPLKRSTSPLRRTPIRRVSKKRRLESRKYSLQRDLFLYFNPVCQICDEQPSTEVHHVQGRTGKNYLDVTTWLAVDRGCHHRIHTNPSWARENGYLK